MAPTIVNVNPNPDQMDAPDTTAAATPAAPVTPDQTAAAPQPSPQDQNIAGAQQSSAPSVQAGPATAPARTLPPSRTTQVHGVLGHVVMGALAAVGHALAQSARTAGRDVVKTAKTIGANTTIGAERQANANAVQVQRQKMQEDAMKSMDDHTRAQVETQYYSQEAYGKLLENQKAEKTAADAADQEQQKFTDFAKEAGVLDDAHGAGFGNLTEQHAKENAQGTIVPVNNGQVGADAGVGFMNVNQAKGTMLPKDYQFVSKWEMDTDPKSSTFGQPKPVETQTIKAGQNSVWDAYQVHRHSEKMATDLQTQFETQQKNQQSIIKTQKDQQDLTKGPAAPKTLGEATAAYTAAEQALRADPKNPDKITARDNAKEMRTNLLADVANESATKAKADASATAYTDAFGNKSTLPEKEFNKRYDDFSKSKMYQNLQTLQGSYQQFQAAINDLNSGKDLTGAQSVVGLFNAIGISATPLAGKGFRINSNTIDEHVGARGIDQAAYQKLLKLKDGDIITPQQLRDYASIATQVYGDAYVNTANEEKRQINYVDVLPQGNNTQIDPVTAHIYLRVAGNDPTKALAAARANGWIVPTIK